PFFIFAIMFLVLPTLYLVLGAFQNAAGTFTFDNIVGIFDPPNLSNYIQCQYDSWISWVDGNCRLPTILAAYWISIKISLASSLI
ncbi:MAG: hypothetical protein E5Y81_09395, partial [Mesorhizobium sp.]